MSDFTVGRCPDCGGIVRYDLTCHTWGGNEDGTGWMACLPCDSAIYYCCDDCGWSYTDGLNPRNPRSVENEKHRPSWLVTARDNYGIGAMAGIPAAWDDEGRQ